MLHLRFLLVCLLVCACTVPLRAAGSADPLLEGEYVPIPLPAGSQMADEELLEVEGELAAVLILLIKVAVSAVLMGGGTAVHQNWFDEDYGIDRDDWGRIANNTFMTFTGGFVNGCTNSCTHSVFGPTFVP